jgi:hypothetical protein
MVGSLGWRLQDRALGVRVAVLAVGLCACGSSADPPPLAGVPSCPELEPGPPVTVDADVRVLASGQSIAPNAGPLVRELITDNQGDVYWFDGAGSVFVQRENEADSVELKHSGAPDSALRPQVVLGMAAGTDQLYVADGFLQTGVDDAGSYFAPPGRLLAISKRDGSAKVLLERQDLTLTPIAADAERVIVFAEAYDVTAALDSGYYQVRFADPQLERLPLAAPFGASQLAGNTVYWKNGSLVRSGFDDAEPEVVLEMKDDYFFSVGPGYILSREDRILPDYHYVGNDFVVHADSGCFTVPSPRAGTLDSMALDAQSAYWYGYPQASDSSLPSGTLNLSRINIESGLQTHLNTPGFTPAPDVRILGQDETRVFLRSQGTLVAVQKP